MTRIRRRWSERQPGWLGRALKDKENWKSAALVLLAVSAVVTLAYVVPTLYRTESEASAGRRASEEVRRGNEAAACRGSFSGAVTDAKTGLDAATAALDDTRASLDVAQAAQQQAFVDLGVAAVDQSEPAYTAALASIGDTSHLVAVLQGHVVTARDDVGAARRHIVRANEAFQALLHASDLEFRARCSVGPPQ